MNDAHVAGGNIIPYAHGMARTCMDKAKILDVGPLAYPYSFILIASYYSVVPHTAALVYCNIISDYLSAISDEYRVFYIHNGLLCTHIVALYFAIKHLLLGGDLAVSQRQEVF